jgi:carbon storage regulator
MLILTRRPSESIIIELPTGEQIEVTVLGIKGNQVKIGTDAPDDIAIVREELLEGLQSKAVKFTKARYSLTPSLAFLEVSRGRAPLPVPLRHNQLAEQLHLVTV